MPFMVAFDDVFSSTETLTLDFKKKKKASPQNEITVGESCCAVVAQIAERGSPEG